MSRYFPEKEDKKKNVCGKPSKAVANIPILWRTFLWRTFPVANLPVFLLPNRPTGQTSKMKTGASQACVQIKNFDNQTSTWKQDTMDERLSLRFTKNCSCEGHPEISK